MATANDIARILIVDDHPFLRDALIELLSANPYMEIVGGASGMRDGLKLAKTKSPDLAIVDISLKEGNGIDLITELIRLDSSIKILVLSMHDETIYAARALRAGASGYVCKEGDANEVLTAVNQVLDGKVYLSPEMTQHMINASVKGLHAPVSPVDLLTNRELQVFEMIGQGATTRAIADRLYLSANTIDSYRERIKKKMNLKGSAELCRTAIQWVLEKH